MYDSKLFFAGGRDDAAYWFEIFLSDMQKLKKGFKILSVTSFYEPSGYNKGLNIFVCYEYNEGEEKNKNES